MDPAPPASTPPPEYSVVVPTCRRVESLARCLDCLQVALARLGRPCEVIVSDDEPGPGAAALLRGRFPWVQFVAGPGRGPAANRNCGARAARAAWLVFTDDDCEPEPDWLVGYAAGRVAHPQAQVLEGRTSAGSRIGPDEESPVNERGGFLWSCNFAIRRDLYDQVGGFDEGFPFPRMEDVDLRERLLGRQVVIPYLPAAAIIHPPRPLRPVAAHIRQAESYFYYARKHGLSVSESGLNPRAMAVTWRDRLRAARGPRAAFVAAGRALAEAALLAWHLPRWSWKYRKSASAVPASSLPRTP